jgi:hypothetical protein
VWNLVSHSEGITQTERASENEVPRRISGLMRDGAKRGWRKMNSEKLDNL